MLPLFFISLALLFKRRLLMKKIFILCLFLLSSAFAKQWVYSKLNGKKIPQLWNGDDILNTIVVAVIDTGVDYTHPDLSSNIWLNEAEANGIAGVDDDGNGYVDDIRGHDFTTSSPDPMDSLGHGTHVAGIIAAKRDGQGITGLNPYAKIMALKSFTEKSGDIEHSIEAIYYAVDNGAHIINCSWIERRKSYELEKAVEYAISKGVIIVAGAGNSGQNLNRKHRYLAEFDDVISVANINSGGAIVSRSNYGSRKIDIAAPGNYILSTIPGGGYGNKSGTSMSSPFVAGAISLLLSLENGHDLNSIKERLYRTGKKSRHYRKKLISEKRIDVYEFIKGK